MVNNYKIDILKFYKRSDSMFNYVYRHQLFACIIVNIITFSHGIALGWTAPIVRKITSNETPLGFKVNLDEASWMVCVTPFGAVVGNFLLSKLIDVLGRKFCLFIVVIPHMIMWTCVYFSPNIEVLCAARFIGGLTAGGIFATVPLFLCEIADVSIRGVLQAFFPIAINFGMVIGYIISSKVDYFSIPLVVMILPILYFLLLFFFPDTPHYLLHKNKDIAALSSFQFYKNSKEFTPNIENNFQELKTAIDSLKTVNETTFSDYFNKSTFKIYITCLVLLILNKYSGIYSFNHYMSTVFEISGAPMDPDSCTIIMGIVQLIGNISTLFFIDRYGRKLLLIISTVGTIFGLTSFGLYTHFNDQINTEKFSWVPLVAMILIIFIGNIGIVPVVMISVVEILPVKIRTTTFPIFMAMLSFLMFVVLKIFPIFMQVFGLSITVWSCALIITFCLIYIIIFLPETKDKSMEKD